MSVKNEFKINSKPENFTVVLFNKMTVDQTKWKQRPRHTGTDNKL